MATNQLMSEDDIRQYFIQNGGIVRNTDIVTYFRTYLSNPAIRDEARILFKTYVNKLATVKVENGDKFLVLKRQYFPPIDGNGNSSIGLPTQPQLGLPTYPSSSSYPSSQLSSHLSSTSLHSISNSISSYSSSSAGPNSYNAPPPYGYPPPPGNGASSGGNPSYLRSNSHPQPQHYGSQFSLSSNYADPYQTNTSTNYGAASLGNYYPHQQKSYNQTQSNYAAYPPPPPAPQSIQQQQHSQQQHLPNYPSPPNPYNNNPSGDYQLEYGLPPVPSSNMSAAPPRRFVSPQNSVGSLSSSGNSLSRIPPPYKPPPPPAPYGSTPAPPPPVGLPNGRRNSVSSGIASAGGNASSMGGSPHRGGPPAYYPGRYSGAMTNNEPSSPPSMFQYHRSLSVNGVATAPVAVTSPTSLGDGKYFDNFGSPSSGVGGNPPPPVPPRAKRSTVERSPSAVVTRSSSSTTGSSSNSSRRSKNTNSNKNSYNHSNSGHSNNNNSGSNNNMMVEEERMLAGGHRDNRHGHGGGDRRSRSNSLHGTVDSIKQNGVSASEHENRRRGSLGVTAIENNENDNEKENINIIDGSVSEGSGGGLSRVNSNGSHNVNNNHHENSFEEGDGSSGSNGNGNSEVEQKISVKERMQKFNRIASESELPATSKMPSARNRKEIAVKHESVDYDSASLSSFGYGFSHVQLDPKAKDWLLKAAKCDYHALNKMAQENPNLVRRKDMNGTALHWAAKHGHVDLVKLLAGSFRSDVNAKSNGGYTPLHLAAQFSRQEVIDILMKTYNADANLRDHSGKKPMQWLVRQDTSVSMDTFKKLKEKRRSTEQQRERDSNSFLRIGSLNVRVKKTTEAFGNFLGKSNSSSNIERVLHKNWGSADNIPEAEVNEKDKKSMPPPSGATVPRSHSSVKPAKRKPRRPTHLLDSLTIKETRSDNSDSDTACGFGNDWKSPNSSIC